MEHIFIKLNMYFASPIYIMKKEMNFTFAKIPNNRKNFIKCPQVTNITLHVERVSDSCLMLNEQIFNNIMVRTS